MATENKTKPTNVSVAEFIEKVPNEQRRADATVILKLMEEITGEQPKMWGPSIIGFGTYHYKYDSGREGDYCRLGFSPRGAASVLYVVSDTDKSKELLKKLGKHRIGKSCLYINKLCDVDMSVLKEIIKDSLDYMNKRYPA